MEIRLITAAQARTVRLPVLRAGMAPETAVLEHDDDPDTRHFGAFDGPALFGVATFFPEPCPLRPGPHGWRLRGMATLPGMQGRGAGRALVAEGIRVARADGAALMWCNARVGALGFYEKLGFAAVGDEFRLPGSGLHYLMIKDLQDPS